MLMQTVFEEWGKKIKDAIEKADPIEVWAWVLISSGIFLVFLLILFTEFKRPERDSIKFSVIIVLLASLCLGLGMHLMLLVYGLW